MKAADYVAKYGEAMSNITKITNDDAVSKLFIEMSGEVATILKDRKVVKSGGVIAVLKEMNDKWNAIISLYEKKWRQPAPISRNGFSKVWMNKMPELQGHLLAYTKEESADA